MTALTDINEGTSPQFTIAWTDPSGSAATPDSVTYRIDDERSGTNVYEETEVDPGDLASTMVIELPGSATQIIDSTRKFENHVLTVVGTFTVGLETKQATKGFRYRVTNLDFHTEA